MYRFSVSSALALGLILIVAPAFAASSHTAHKSGAVRRVGHRIRHRIAHPLGQRAIAPERATQIQTALIRKNYLTGSPSGQWDAQTETAMQKFQADHGWQTKLTPDSRALIKLGLGPHDATPPPSASVPPISGVSSDDPAHPSPAGTLAATNSIQN